MKKRTPICAKSGEHYPGRTDTQNSPELQSVTICEVIRGDDLEIS
jgi:hypothetical protein